MLQAVRTEGPGCVAADAPEVLAPADVPGDPVVQRVAAAVHADLAILEATGHLLLGEPTVSGVMVMLLTCSDLPVLLTCQRLVTLYGWLNHNERAA